MSPTLVGDVPAGNVSGLPVGALMAVDGEPVCIGRDSGGVYAMTLTCTHAGCNMGQSGSISPQGIFCACHGSMFDVTGNVVRGPATQPLDHLGVSIDSSGELTVHGSQIVPANARLAV